MMMMTVMWTMEIKMSKTKDNFILENKNESIHTSLDENNYEVIDMSKVEKEEVIVVLEKNKKAVTNSMTWRTEQPPQRVRQGPQNIIKYPAGIKPEYRETIEPLDSWSLFGNDDMIQMIVIWTNQSIKQSLSKCKQSTSNENVSHLYETNEREMKAFIGLWYIHGLLNWNNSDITFAYSQIYGNKILNATISIKRF